MNVLSLFDGMSGTQIALERLGFDVDKYYASEIDKYAIAVTQYNYPRTIQLGDINNWREWDIDWSSIDLIVGGSPCQGLSQAGRGAGLDDSRSKLFFVFIDILEYVKKTNPNVFFLLENVVPKKKEWAQNMTAVIGVEPIMIDSALLSAQSRKRLYWTNASGVDQPENKGIFWDSVHSENELNAFYYTENSFDWINKDSKRSQKFTIYRQNTQTKMQMIEASHHKGYSNQRCFGIQDISGIRYISPLECERLQTAPDEYTSMGDFNGNVKKVSNTQRYKMLGNGFTVDVIAHILKNIKDKQCN